MHHAQVNRHGRAVAGQVVQLLAGGHRRLARVAGKDQRLRHLGQGQLAFQQGGAGGGGGHPRDDLEGDRQRAQLANLLADGAIQRGVAGMHAGHILALGMRLADQLDNLLQVQFGGVDHQFGTIARKYCLRHQ